MSTAVAEGVHAITWDSLVPKASPLENPFARLTDEQRDDLSLVAFVRDSQARGQTSDVAADVEDALEAAHRLQKRGLDVEMLLEQYRELAAEVDRRNEAVAGELDGQTIRMPGYALPLEFTEAGVKEFLLVPYVGACIHVPPPPVNQTVFVRLAKPFKAADLYTPVWITGRMTVKRTSQSLSYVDGRADIGAGYTLDGTKVEPYKQ